MKMKGMAGTVVPLPPTNLCFEVLGALKDLLHGQGGGEHSRLPLDDALDDRVHVLGGGTRETTSAPAGRSKVIAVYAVCKHH